MVLFRVVTLFQLFNAIHMKMNLLADESADIILTDSVDFSSLIVPLKQTGLFHNVWFMKVGMKNQALYHMSPEKKAAISRNPLSYIELPCTNENYTDYYIAMDDYYAVLTYYALIGRGCKMRVHMFDEGMYSYTRNPIIDFKNVNFDHKYYGKKNYINSITRILLYEPALYVYDDFPVERLPKIDRCDQRLASIIYGLFGRGIVPSQPYVFFEEIPLNEWPSDIALLELLADIWGKKSIAIKRHPRGVVDRYTRRGFRVMQQVSCPWEVVLLNQPVEDKVFITINSASAINTSLVFGDDCKIIMLTKLPGMAKGIQAESSMFKTYIEKAEAFINQDKRCLFLPNSKESLIETARYIEGVRKCCL